MTRFIWLSFCFVVCFALAGTIATASEYHFSGGYWWRNGVAYERGIVSRDGYYYWSGGCRYWQPAYQEYSYTPAKIAVSYKDADWKTKLLELAAARDKVEGEIRKNAAEYSQFKEAIDALGLKGNFRWDGYGAAPPGYSSHASVTGATGNTVYGYSYNTIASVYGDVKLESLYQQSARLAESAQKFSAQANQDFGALVGQEGANRAKVAEILAKGQAARETLEALRDPSKIQTSESVIKVVPNGERKADASGVKPAFASMANAKCASCHSGSDPKGKFAIADYPALTIAQRLAVIDRLTTRDDSKLMPRAKDGGPGQRLTEDEIRLFLEN